MANTILTPVTLWKDFDDSLPFEEETISEREFDGMNYREVYFLGRQTQFGRVKIYAKYYTPVGVERFPAVLVMFEAGFPCDEQFVKLLLREGYGVLAVDYCGNMGAGKHTVYPDDVDYANYLRAGRAMEYADITAKETSWYEWTAVARYAARWLSEREEVTKTGAVGLRTGGEILWKITPYAPVSCFVSVGAAGWLAYRDMEKFSSEKNEIFSEERHRFIAGIDSQSYAPHAKCPVLLLCAINDKKCNYDRVYDTFQQINPEVEKAILYSAHGNGLIGHRSFVNLDLFLGKYLKGHSVYISKPISCNAFQDDNGNFKARVKYDAMGEPSECGVFFTENTSTYKARDWTRVLADGNSEADKNNSSVVLPLEVFEGSERALVYAFVHYSNGFSVTSKIQEVALGTKHKGRLRSRILFSSENGSLGFAAFRRRARSIADCFSSNESIEVSLLPGYGGIPGISTKTGIITYRVSEPRFEPHEGALFQFDAWCERDATLRVVFYIDAEEQNGYEAEFQVAGGGKWKKFSCESMDFKAAKGLSLEDFTKAVSVVFLGKGDVLVNNIIWL